MTSDPSAPSALGGIEASPSHAAPSAPLLLSSGWRLDFRPLDRRHQPQQQQHDHQQRHAEGVILASLPLSVLHASDRAALEAVSESRAARAALADYAARALGKLLPVVDEGGCRISTMEQSRRGADASDGTRRRRRRGRPSGGARDPVPFVLERSDCLVTSGRDGGDAALAIFLRASLPVMPGSEPERTISPVLEELGRALTSHECHAHVACVVLQRRLRGMLQPPRRSGGDGMGSNGSGGCSSSRNGGSEEKKADDDGNDGGEAPKYLDAVAFIADGSLLPRRSGRSSRPMTSPPAVPFCSPEGSEKLTRVVTVKVGKFWRRFLNADGSVANVNNVDEMNGMVASTSSDSVTMRGMIIPCGVTLIVGGGYHGKSTLLQALCYGVYDSVPGDGREWCVSHPDAVSIRVEDGQYIHDVNVSAFISNLPSGRSINGASIASKKDTTRFSTRDASGSTSQAANVIESLEAGASALLVDEDVSAANFMARDGRMRAMIMDEPITPLLYRVNGLYLSKRHKTSTVVVVGGVGEWLDVADAVVLMKDYRAHDGLEKARSVSYQFSYGHVQYAGKGVVHRLPWEFQDHSVKKKAADCGGEQDVMEVDDEEKDKKKTLSPLRRRPDPDCLARKFRDAVVHLPEGGGSSRLWLYRDDDDNEHGGDDGQNSSNDNCSHVNCDDDDDDGAVDLSKCSQLVPGAPGLLYGIGICVLWLLRESTRRPRDDVGELLDRMDWTLDRVCDATGGLNGMAASLSRRQKGGGDDADDNLDEDGTAFDARALLSLLTSSGDALDLWEVAGSARRPRRHEVAMALTRLRGVRFEELPEKPEAKTISSEEEARRIEEESKKRALADLWANRRKR
ncbi:hypothetical protein ACHAWF_006414 [Thalassiosira exigua]